MKKIHLWAVIRTRVASLEAVSAFRRRRFESRPRGEFFSFFDAFFQIFIDSIEFLVFFKVNLTFFSNFLNDFQH